MQLDNNEGAAPTKRKKRRKHEVMEEDWGEPEGVKGPQAGELPIVLIA